MSKPTPPSAAEAALQRLLWDAENALTSWAARAATAVLQQLPANCERSGYRHDVSIDGAGVVTHELVEFDSSLPVCLLYERPDGSPIVGFCLPWPVILRRFIEAILERDLLGADEQAGAPITDQLLLPGAATAAAL